MATQLSGEAAGGRDNCEEKTVPSQEKNSSPSGAAWPFSHYPSHHRLLTKRAGPRLLLQRPGPKHLSDLRGMSQDGESVSVCVQGGGDGVESKASPLHFHNPGTTGGHDREFQGSGLGIWDIRISVRKESGV